MICKKCGAQLEDDAEFCANCGEMVSDSDSVESGVNDVQTDKGNKRLAFIWSDKFLKIMFIAGLVSIGLGILIFLGIVLVGVIVYGRVYLFDGYDFTKVLTIISIILMLLGVCVFIFCFVIGIVKKPNNIIVKKSIRILMVALAVVSIGFSVWGFVDCSANSEKSGSSTQTYVNFYEIYAECDLAYPWAQVATSYLLLDSNPYNYDSDNSNATRYVTVVSQAIQSIHSLVGVPSYVYQQMIRTAAIDGVQYYSGTRVNIRWTYHPDRGLEVMYTHA